MTRTSGLIGLRSCCNPSIRVAWLLFALLPSLAPTAISGSFWYVLSLQGIELEAELPPPIEDADPLDEPNSDGQGDDFLAPSRGSTATIARRASLGLTPAIDPGSPARRVLIQFDFHTPYPTGRCLRLWLQSQTC